MLQPKKQKTTFALRLAAACSTGTAMPGMESLSPFNVIYQSAEDGLEDTIKPRLTEAKKNIAGIVSRKVGTKWMWSIPNEDCNIAEVSSDEE